MHRDTSLIVDQCSDKIQRGTCAKNTVRFLKDDPDVACPQCTVRVFHNTPPTPSENLSGDGEGNLVDETHDDSDLETSWAQDNFIQPFLASRLQLPSSIPSSSRPASTQFDFQHPLYLHLDDDMEELSHEDGIQLIDEMYGAEHYRDHSSNENKMNLSDDEMYCVPTNGYHDLEQAHDMIHEVMNHGQKDGMADASMCLQRKDAAAALIEVSDSNQMGIEANIFEARELLHRAQQELDKLRHTRQEIESDFLWSLEKYSTLTQISVDGRL